MAAEFFAFRAKTYLEIEMDSPSLAVVQALLVLSSHEAAQMRDSRGKRSGRKGFSSPMF